VEPLDLSFADVSFPLDLSGCAFIGELSLRQSRIKALGLEGSRTQTIAADGMDVKGDVFLSDGFKAEGEVGLLNVTIGGQLDCAEGQFINPNGDALTADGMDVKGDVVLGDGFKAEGEVRLLDTTIGSQLDCSEGQFINPGRVALDAEGMDVKGSVFLRGGFKAEGEVRLLGATIGGQLDCSEGEFINPDGVALNADGMDVKSDVFLCDGFKAEGEVSLVSTVVARDLKVRDVREPEKARFDFTSTTIDTLLDDEASWPAKGNLVLDGFVYRRLDQHSPHNVKARIRWLGLQPTDRFYPSPYEQLAKVLQESGYVDAAKRVLIAKNKDPAKLKELSRPKRVLHRVVLGGVTGYGYRPWRALWIGVALVFIGWGLFFAAEREGIMVPAQSEAVPVYTPFHALPYSIDVFVPLVDLEQADYWTPHEGRSGTLFTLGNYAIPLSGLFLRVVMWVLNILGWILTTLLVTGLTGVIRRRFDY